MRELKFRAWDEQIKEFRNSGTIQLKLSGKPFILIPNKNSFLIEDLEYIVINQFTGLKDKNGVDIYEGDIVSDEHSNGVVFYNLDNAQFMVDFSSIGEESPQEMCNNLKWATVIGNIHSDPELL